MLDATDLERIREIVKEEIKNAEIVKEEIKNASSGKSPDTSKKGKKEDSK